MFVRANINILKWESEFFKRLIAKLDFIDNAKIISIYQLNQFDIVQVKIDSCKKVMINKLEKIGFFFVDGEINFLLKIGSGNIFFNNTLFKTDNIDIAKHSDIDLLCKAAEVVFNKSRFCEPWYSKKDSGRFYALWIKKAVLGEFDDICLLIKNSVGVILGFVSLRDIDINTARIGVLAKIPGMYSENIGRKLMSAAFYWCLQHKKKYLNIVTQVSNIAAMNLYLRSGAFITSTEYWLYRGYNDSI
ncbi:wecD [Candidatus Providencia siddallii]|uniref:WecD protein n=1 Tax=Candidatus Providencia siddallii TaxID=1715285 RepID=A0A0M6W9Z0_9GAMM|nr:wecD [Candidatus Providencia siddallii]